MYTVTINNTYSGLKFKFYNFDDMMAFVGQVIEQGTYTSCNGEKEPVRAIIEYEEVLLNG